MVVETEVGSGLADLVGETGPDEEGSGLAGLVVEMGPDEAQWFVKLGWMSQNWVK